MHIYRFSKTGKPMAGFFKGRKVKSIRKFPSNCQSYVKEYYSINRKAGIIAFVGC